MVPLVVVSLSLPARQNTVLEDVTSGKWRHFRRGKSASCSNHDKWGLGRLLLAKKLLLGKYSTPGADAEMLFHARGESSAAKRGFAHPSPMLCHAVIKIEKITD